METFTLRAVSFTYPSQTEAAVEKVSLAVEEGAFLVLCGPSGCGKTTLLRQLKPELAPHGTLEGEILFEGTPLPALDHRTRSQKIGFVQQNPDNQIVTDKVWHELAFGLESLGFDTPTIRRRVAEMASFFGIESWFYKSVTELSGGQKQLLNLASVMVMQPKVLILDEPTSQLDPIAASDFLAVLGKINRELGTTIVLTEHRLEEAFALASRVVVMDRGRVLCQGTPQQVGEELKKQDHAMFLAMPAAMRIWASVEDPQACPITVKDGRRWLAAYAADHPLHPLPQREAYGCSGQTVLQAEEVWFRYEKEGCDVARGFSLQVGRGEFLAILGGNGAGKSTCLKLLGGLLKPYRGTIRCTERVGILPQDPQVLFVKKTLREDLLETEVGQEELRRVVGLCRLEGLLQRHPYDLSGGEQQRAALAKILLCSPQLLLLDEPTKGLDAEFKQVFARILSDLLQQNMTIVMVSHDVEFCAQYARRCALFFDGHVVAQGEPREFFSGNSFYTTSANRMARSICPQAVTAEELIAVCGGRLPRPKPRKEEAQEEPVEVPADKEPLPKWRKALAAVTGCGALGLLCYFAAGSDLTKLVGAGELSGLSVRQLVGYGMFVLCLLIFGICISRRQAPAVCDAPRRKLPGRTVAAAVLILLLIPLTLFAGQFLLAGRRYLVISVLIMLEMMVPFFLVFEGRKPQARELVVIAVLCAIGVAGRAAFFMLPEFKPVWAITILAGVALGGEAGFLVGAMTMLASNVLFSQGPWTPWQMFAMGLVGFLAGILFRKGLLRRGKVSLCLYGAISCIVIYGGIMNTASALMWSADINGSILLTYFITGFPVDCVHAAATWLFLWFAAEPMLEKLSRIKEKYGLIQ